MPKTKNPAIGGVHESNISDLTLTRFEPALRFVDHVNLPLRRTTRQSRGAASASGVSS